MSMIPFGNNIRISDITAAGSRAWMEIPDTAMILITGWWRYNIRTCQMAVRAMKSSAMITPETESVE